MAVQTEKQQPTKETQQRLLFSDLQEHNAFFDFLVDMINPKLYIPGASGDDYNPKYFKGQHKENKEARRAQKKASKRAKFDPSLTESTTKQKSRLDAEKFQKNSNENATGTSTPRSHNGVNGSKNLLPQKGHAKASTPSKVVKGNTNKKAQDDTNENKTDTSNDNNKLNKIVDNKSRIEALRAKLHAKIAEKGGNRPTDPTVVSKRAARRTEKARRKEEAIKRKQQGQGAQTKVNGSRSNGAAYTSLGVASDGRASVDVAQDLAKIDFGRITGLNAAAPNYKNNKALANVSKAKNLEKILADAEEKKQKLADLKRSSKQEDKEKLAKMQWTDTIKEASGERVKDDPNKIKNKLKRKAVKKAKSQKAWKSRMDQMNEKQQERQKIRSHNLDKRKLGGAAGSNLSKKRIADDDDKKAKMRPGFEGKKKGFLNDVKHQ